MPPTRDYGLPPPAQDMLVLTARHFANLLIAAVTGFRAEAEHRSAWEATCADLQRRTGEAWWHK